MRWRGAQTIGGSHATLPSLSDPSDQTEKSPVHHLIRLLWLAQVPLLAPRWANVRRTQRNRRAFEQCSTSRPGAEVKHCFRSALSPHVLQIEACFCRLLHEYAAQHHKSVRFSTKSAAESIGLLNLMPRSWGQSSWLTDDSLKHMWPKLFVFV